MEPKSPRLLPILFVITIVSILLLSILTTPKTAIAAQPQVAAGRYHTLGVKSDGTVVAIGWNLHGQLNVSTWTDIVQISASGHHTVGLKFDGTVVAVGSNDEGQLNVGTWTDIVQVSAGGTIQRV